MGREGFFKRLSYDLRQGIPDTKGFSVTNLTYMKYFYSTYNQYLAIYPQLGDKLEKAIFSIPWGHHKVLIDNFRMKPEKAVFFVRKTIENGWSRLLLQNFVKTDLCERSGKAAITNFSTTFPSPDSSIAQDVLKDPYKINTILNIVFRIEFNSLKRLKISQYRGDGRTIQHLNHNLTK